LLLEGPQIEPLLAQIHAEHGADAKIVKAERVRAGGVGGFFARERYEVTVEVEEAPAAPAEDAPASVEDLLAAVDATERAAQQVTAPSTSGGFRGSQPDLRPQEPATGSPQAAFAQVLTAVTAAPVLVEVPPVAQPAGLTGLTELSALGVPDELLVHLGPGDVVPQLFDILDRLPKAPPLHLPDGGVVAVVGPRREAVRAATVLAERLRLDPGAIFHACGHDPAVPARRRITGVAEARRRAALSRARAVPLVVVVETDVDADQEQWAAEMLDALAADQIWAVVDATRKTGDLRRHLRAVAGPTGVDCLAVTGTGCTADPASVLALGMPVGILDGRPATTGAWAALLIDRLHGDRHERAA
jgi:hypothetical protein